MSLWRSSWRSSRTTGSFPSAVNQAVVRDSLFLQWRSFVWAALAVGCLVLAWPVVSLAAEEADDLQDDIEKVEKRLKDAAAKKNQLETNLGRINSSLSATMSAIQKTQTALKQTENVIEHKELEIELLEQQITLKMEILKSLVQDAYFNDATPLIQIVLSEEDISAGLDEAEHYAAFQARIQELLDEVQTLRDRTEQETLDLEALKETHEETLEERTAQKQDLASDQVETQADLVDQEKVVNRLNKELNELEGDLSKLLGKSYNAKDIQEAVNFASKQTGVPKGFLFGVLKMETNLGANVGGCTYAEVEKGAEANYKAKRLSKTSWNTFQYRRTLFKTITKELDLDYKKQKVSCNPKNYRGTGGAMGVAQFMPDTWNGYKSQVSSVTGHRPPSPWNLTDGVTAMALKLKKVPGVTAGKKSAMRQAACSYLGTCYAPYINGILYWADNYKQLL